MKICEIKDCKNETNDAVLWDGKDYHEICEVHHSEMPKDFEFKPKIKNDEKTPSFSLSSNSPEFM